MYIPKMPNNLVLFISVNLYPPFIRFFLVEDYNMSDSLQVVILCLDAPELICVLSMASEQIKTVSLNLLKRNLFGLVGQKKTLYLTTGTTEQDPDENTGVRNTKTFILDDQIWKDHQVDYIDLLVSTQNPLCLAYYQQDPLAQSHKRQKKECNVQICE
jgi:hypothetical protein